MTGLLKLPCLCLVIPCSQGDAEKGGNVAEGGRTSNDGKTVKGLTGAP